MNHPDSGTETIRPGDANPTDSAEAIDGFTWSEIRCFVTDSVIDAICEACGAVHRVEPDAMSYDCHNCDARGAVTSPLVTLGLV